MKVRLYMAVSIDGYIATQNDDTSWVADADWEEFQKAISKHEVVVMGRRTYEKAVGEGSFPKDKTVYVLTRDVSDKNDTDLIHFVSETPQKLIKRLAKEKVSDVLVIGGGIVNAAFLHVGLLDEITVSVHPLVLGKGLKLFSEMEAMVKLQLQEMKKLEEDLVQLRYVVVK